MRSTRVSRHRFPPGSRQTAEPAKRSLDGFIRRYRWVEFGEHLESDPRPTDQLLGVAVARRRVDRRDTRGLSVTQSSSIQAVAPGIAEALVATATGLIAAIPAVVAFNHFARHIRVLSAEMENFSSEFLNIAERHFLK